MPNGFDKKGLCPACREMKVLRTNGEFHLHRTALGTACPGRMPVSDTVRPLTHQEIKEKVERTLNRKKLTATP